MGPLFDTFVNSISSTMAKGRSQNQQPGKNGPNNAGGGGSASTTDPGKSQNLKQKDPEPKSATPAGPHPDTPPVSPQLQRLPLSGSSRLADALELYLGGSGDAATADPSIRDPTAIAVSDLQGAMQGSLRALVNAFDVLGEQALHVFSLGPAMDAHSQLEVVQRGFNEMAVRQDEQMQEVKEKNLETVKEHVRQVLRPKVDDIVAGCVRNVIEDRVHHELTVQIPAALREELLRYRVRIMEARRDLHNSEARRHNALVRSSGLGEPLKPLLRPVHLSAGPDASADLDETLDASEENDKNKQGNKEMKNNGKDKDKGAGTGRDKKKDNKSNNNTGMPTPPSTAASVASAATSRTARQGTAANRLSVNTTLSAATSAAVTASEGPPGSALSSAGGADAAAAAAGGWDVAAPTASPHFPRTLAALVSMSAEQAKTLAREYGLLVHDDEDGGDGQQGGGEDGANARQARGAGAGRGGTRGGNARGGRGERGGGARGGRTAAERPASVATTAGSDAASWENAGLAGTREDNLNKFMRYIGVGFQVLPSTPIATGGGSGSAMFSSPVVERRDCAFTR